MTQSLISPKALAGLLRERALLDPRLGSFRLGDVYETESVFEDTYPLMIYELASCKMVINPHGSMDNEYTVRLYCFDQRLDDNSNLEDAFSDTQNIAQDLAIRVIQDEALLDMGFAFGKGIFPIDYVIKTGQDNLIGVTLDLTITTPIVLCASDLPQ